MLRMGYPLNKGILLHTLFLQMIQNLKKYGTQQGSAVLPQPRMMLIMKVGYVGKKVNSIV
jgi:hypothetical protein